VVFLRIILFPVSLIYGLVVIVRNKLFDIGLLRSTSFDIPIISLGNLTYGGTGKTPHVEYLVRLLEEKQNIAILSRGYGRSTRGFKLASEKSTVTEIGDEALQFKKKFPFVEVAVDENRPHGIRTLLKKHPELDVILLDDAFQHRYVKPGLSILLTDFHKLFTRDHLLPTGTLREPVSGAKRADIIVVTKTGSVLSPIVQREIEEELKPHEDQKTFYSFTGYETLISLKDGKSRNFCKKYSGLLLVAGIANPYPLRYFLQDKCTDLNTLFFRDHHKYTHKDIQNIKHTFDNIFTKNKIIITTEKDAMRFQEHLDSPELQDLPIYYLPIKMEFHQTGSVSFDQVILDYVCKKQ